MMANGSSHPICVPSSLFVSRSTAGSPLLNPNPPMPAERLGPSMNSGTSGTAPGSGNRGRYRSTAAPGLGLGLGLKPPGSRGPSGTLLTPSTWRTPLRSNANSNTEFVRVEPTYGRSPAGVACTATNHDNPIAARVTPPIATSRSRRLHGAGAHHAYASKMPGITNAAASIFVVIAAPAATHATSSQRSRPHRTASIVHTAAAVISSVSTASVLLEWLTITKIGVTASTVAPMNAAVRPHVRRRPQYSNPTAAAPASTSGSSTAYRE